GVFSIMKGFEFTWEMGIRIGVIAAIAIIMLRVNKWIMDPFIKKSSDYLKIDRTRYRFFRNALNAVIIITAFILIIDTIPALRSVSMTLFAGAGIFAAAIAFASQQALSNIISGVFVVISKPFRVGDTISIGNPPSDYFGTVEDITLRHTVIKDLENARIIIPNSIINMQTLTNYHIIDPRSRKRMLFKVGPKSDIKKAITIIQEEIYAHPNFQRDTNIQSPADVDVQVIEYMERFLTLRAYAWTADIDKGFELAFDVNRDVMIRFNKEGIDISDTRITQ
ncbi:MAG: mechanosensitive ion channel family protein, partial [Flavobacteriales bacterium]